MTALAKPTQRWHATPIGQTYGKNTWGIRGDKGVIYPGAMMMLREGEEYIEIVSAVTDGIAIGWADIPFAIDTAGLTDGAKTICVRDGIVGYLDSATAGDAVDNTLRHRTVYLGNDNTVFDSDGGTRSCPVQLDSVSSDGVKVWIGPQGPTGPAGP